MRGTSDRCCVRCCKSKPVIFYLFYHNIWELMPYCPNQIFLKQNNSKRTKLVRRVWKVVMFHAQGVLRLHQKTCRVYNLRRLNRRKMWKTKEQWYYVVAKHWLASVLHQCFQARCRAREHDALMSWCVKKQGPSITAFGVSTGYYMQMLPVCLFSK